MSKKPKPNHPRQGSVRRKYQALAMGLEGQQYADYVYGNMQEFWLKYGEGRVPWDGRLAEVQETQYLYKLLAEAYVAFFTRKGELTPLQYRYLRRRYQAQLRKRLGLKGNRMLKKEQLEVFLKMKKKKQCPDKSD